MHILDHRLWFPPLTAANDDGMLAIGGDLSLPRLLLAYRSGIFPWYSGDIPLWWSPDPRFVLFPEKLHIGKHLQRIIRQQQFNITVNKAFAQVIDACAETPRPGQDGTWINHDMSYAFNNLHKEGWAHSFEAWQDGKLVGGMYGVRLGNIFFGESMFSSVSYASKAAFVFAVQSMQQQGLSLIDCQVYTPYLESFGAEMIPRSRFLPLLKQCLDNDRNETAAPRASIL